MSETREEIVDFIASDLLEGSPDQPISEARLLSGSVIDSFGVFTLIGFLEDRFDIVVDADEVRLETFDTVDSIVDLVERKRGGAAPDGSS